MALGDHLYVDRGSYFHHAIDCGDGTVIDYSGETDREEDARVRRRSMADFANGCQFFVVAYGMCFPPEIVVQRASSKVGEAKYHVLLNNCEHFATWCKTGVPISHQTNRVALFHGLCTGVVTMVALIVWRIAVLGLPGLNWQGIQSGLADLGTGSPFIGLVVSIIAVALGSSFLGWIGNCVWKSGDYPSWYAINIFLGIVTIVGVSRASFIAGENTGAYEALAIAREATKAKATAEAELAAEKARLEVRKDLAEWVKVESARLLAEEKARVAAAKANDNTRAALAYPLPVIVVNPPDFSARPVYGKVLPATADLSVFDD